MHVPKCAGSSVHAALEASMPRGAIASRRFDRSVFCGFSRFDALPPPLRGLVAVSDREVNELRRHRVVSGHFSLPTLLRIAPSSSIATVIREPRARLLSLYAYWRSADFEAWHPYVAHQHAHRPVEEFLAEPEVAPAIDNQLSRLVLADDPLIPTRGFIADDAVPTLAERTLACLRELGFVGVQELSDVTWTGLSRFFGVPLACMSVNVTPTSHAGNATGEGISAESLELIERRTAVAQIVYRRIVEQIGGCDGERFAAAAFAERLAQFDEGAAGADCAA